MIDYCYAWDICQQITKGCLSNIFFSFYFLINKLLSICEWFGVFLFYARVLIYFNLFNPLYVDCKTIFLHFDFFLKYAADINNLFLFYFLTYFLNITSHYITSSTYLFNIYLGTKNIKYLKECRKMIFLSKMKLTENTWYYTG